MVEGVKHEDYTVGDSDADVCRAGTWHSNSDGGKLGGSHGSMRRWCNEQRCCGIFDCRYRDAEHVLGCHDSRVNSTNCINFNLI